MDKITTLGKTNLVINAVGVAVILGSLFIRDNNKAVNTRYLGLGLFALAFTVRTVDIYSLKKA